MKKIFTLIAVALATMSVNAQEKYVAIERNAETGVMTLSEEFKAVLPFNEENGTYGDVATNKDERGSVVVMKTASVTCVGIGGAEPADVWDDPTDADGNGEPENRDTHVDMNADGTVNSWKDIKWQQKNQGDINWAWIQGTGNPSADITAEVVMTDDMPATYVDENGVEKTKYRPDYKVYNPDGSHGCPEVGLHYQFTASVAGTIKIGVWINKGNRKFYVVDGTTALPIQFKAEGYINGQNHKILPEGATDSVSVKKYLSSEEIDSIHKAAKVNAETGEDTAPYIVGAGNQPFFGYITFEMEAGKTYYVFNDNTQLGFNGWEFTPSAVAPAIPDNAIYFWESPDGTPVEKGGKMEYLNGEDDPAKYRLNYPNANYYTICLNGKKANMNDAPSANAGYMLLTLDEALQAGDFIDITAYRNKNADDKNATIMFYFENGAEWADTKSFVNICADENDEDYDDDGATPNTHTWEITAAEAGSKTIKLTRNSASTNLFITKFIITRGASGIQNVEVATPANNVIYNLSGQKVDANFKGIIIVNGKKFFNK